MEKEQATHTIRDIKEIDSSYQFSDALLSLLLLDKTTNKNIVWATDNYQEKGYFPHDQITAKVLKWKGRKLIKPRIEKSKKEQLKRSKQKAEVFTPSWMCNQQNNLIDRCWFGDEPPFNVETERGWKANAAKIVFSKAGKTWQEYVLDIRLEITCGEAPYLTSRYDTVTGDFIEVENRIGLLDRKLRIVDENASSDEEWIEWTEKAFKSIYGFEYQGDNLFIARENLLSTFVDHYKNRFGALPDFNILQNIIEIIVWNVFQMDGLKFVVPDSCNNERCETVDIFGNIETHSIECPGCKNNDPKAHNGKYCYTKDWEKNRKVKFLSLIKG